MPSVIADTLSGLFLERVAASPARTAFQYPVGSTWESVTWAQVNERVRHISLGLRALGLESEQRCALLCSTRYEWIAADLAIVCAGGATTTIYPSNTPDECAFIIQDSGTVIVLAENDDQVAKLQSKRGELPTVKHVVTVDGRASDDGWVLTLEMLESKGRARHAEKPSEFEQVARAVRKEQLATLIYTSGTTGKPKGVELTQDAWAYEAEAIDKLGFITADDFQYLWLPLSHVFGKVLTAAQVRIGFLTAVDGRVDKLIENLGVVKPTFVAAVPRIFEKVHNRVIQSAKDGGPTKFKIFRWALGVGRAVSKAQQAGRGVGPVLALQQVVAHRLVFSKLQARFGGKLRFFVSGSAPLSRELAEFFHAVGILICEGYGLTETSAASFVNKPGKFRFGTVGPPLPGTEVKLAPEDGEVLIRSRGVMRGYHGLKEATAESLDSEGWLHTGDIGSMEDGFLRITDRKKDLIKTSGGKYVAPQAVEGQVIIHCPYASQVLVHGNNRNFVVALVALDPDSISKWAKDNGLADKSYAELTQAPEVKKLVQGCIDTVNKGLAGYESIRKFSILSNDLTLESGDLTPSLKLKRKAVEAKYKDTLEAFFTGSVAQY